MGKQESDLNPERTHPKLFPPRKALGKKSSATHEALKGASVYCERLPYFDSHLLPVSKSVSSIFRYVVADLKTSRKIIV